MPIILPDGADEQVMVCTSLTFRDKLHGRDIRHGDNGDNGGLFKLVVYLNYTTG